MARYVVYIETTIVKQAVVEVEDARGVADAVEQGKKKAKAGEVIWGNAEVDLEVVNVEEKR